ncbi:uncharacterized protein [Dermacentor albipictus]|uniref:uncharacterized protein isoform X3 n=1 Tax=Dermacentor albipictus TaxID=60249 RepID=UPI0038FC486F
MFSNGRGTRMLAIRKLVSFSVESFRHLCYCTFRKRMSSSVSSCSPILTTPTEFEGMVLAVCLSTQVSSRSPAPGEWHANYNIDLIWPLFLPDDHCHIIEIFICSPTLVTFPVDHVTARTAINGFASSMVASGPGSSAPNTMLKPSCLHAQIPNQKDRMLG